MTDWSPELLIGTYAIGATLIVIGAIYLWFEICQRLNPQHSHFPEPQSAVMKANSLCHLGRSYLSKNVTPADKWRTRLLLLRFSPPSWNRLGAPSWRHQLARHVNALWALIRNQSRVA